MNRAKRGNKRGKSRAAEARQKICRTQVIDLHGFYVWQRGKLFATLKLLILKRFLVRQTSPPLRGDCAFAAHPPSDEVGKGTGIA